MGLNFCYSWHNVSVRVYGQKSHFWDKQTQYKSILDKVSGYSFNNSLIAIMGASGSGKTSLLGAISGRLVDEEVRKLSAYIPQNNVFTETLTVFEHMKFMAAFKTNTYEDGAIITLIDEFGLDRNTLINCLSGGEKRKLALATELIHNPYILFCDEITTGLDSFSAMSVVQKLEELSHTGKIIIMTVHQPSSQLFQLFNNVILLANGRLIFQGTKEETAMFFDKNNLICPSTYNPSDYYIKCLNDKNIELSLYSHKKKIFTNYRHFKSLSPARIRQKSFYFQLNWLLWRVYLDSKRNLNRHLLSYTVLVITGLILATSYANITIEDANSVQNIQGAVLFAISELIFSHMYYVIFVFPSEINIFLNERHLYKPFPYFLSKLISTIPTCLINTFTYVAIYFIFLKFLNGFAYFCGMLFILFITTVSATAFGLCLSALFPTVEYIDLFIVPIEVLVMTLSGLWIKIDTVPKFFGLIKYISPFYFTFEGLSIMQWSSIEDFRNCSKVITPCYESGEAVLNSFGFQHDLNVINYNILYLHILILVYSIIGYLSLIRKLRTYSFY